MASEDTADPDDSARDRQRVASRAMDARLAARARLAASGRYLVQPSAVATALVPTTWGDALDLPEDLVVAATQAGPAEAAGVFPSLGIIQPIRNNSFVVLSTGLADSAGAGAPAPEPGRDFAPVGVDGDTVTLTLDLQVPPGANRMSLQYNFLSSESPDFVGSIYNDTFSIRLEDGTGVRDFVLASVNSSFFFDASDSRAEGTGYDIYTPDPANVDSLFGNGVPDAGLTDFQAFSAPVTPGGPLRVVFTITDNGDGVLDSAVLLDALQFGALEAVDPQPDLVRVDGTLNLDVDELATRGRFVRGVIADGETELLLRMKVPGPGIVTFSIAGPTPAADGALCTLTDLACADSAQTSLLVASVRTITSGEYAYALYRAPADLGGAGPGRSIAIEAAFAPVAGGGAFTEQTELLLRRPPVVLSQGLWSKETEWSTHPFVTDPSFAITYADQPYTCADELRILEDPANPGACPHPLAGPGAGVPICLADRRNEVGATTRDATAEAIENARREGFAATQADVVAHGAAGVYARRYIDSAGYKRASNRMRGDINRLITISTPHFGSRVAGKIATERDAMVEPARSDTMCSARNSFVSPVEPGDIDMITPATVGLAASDVPGHAIYGTGGLVLPANNMRFKLGTRMTLYFVYKIGASLTPTAVRSSLNTLMGEDHDLFTGVASLAGGLGGAQVTTLPLNAGDSQFFGSLADPRISDPIKGLLEGPLTGPTTKFAPFAASPTPLAATTDDERREGGRVTSLLPPGARLRIVSPAPGTAVPAGKLIEVQVVGENGFAPTSVTALTTSTSATSEAAPFTLQVRIPADAIGPIKLLAYGTDANDESLIAEDVLLNATVDALLTDVSILQQDPILYGLGSNRRITVVGDYDDGVARDITRLPGVLYLSSNPSIVAVSSTGVLTAIGPGIATVVAQAGSKQDSITVTVRGNSAPLAVASGSVALSCVAPGEVVPVQLDGSGSYDPDGDPIELVWLENGSQIATGPSATVDLGPGLHTIVLQATDAQGSVSESSVNVSIGGDTEAPLITILGESPRTIECTSAYTDPGATALDECDGDLTAGIVAQSQVNPGAPGTYAVSYRVEDAAGQVATATRTVIVQDTTPPALACPAPAVAECTANGQAVVDLGAATASDACGGATASGPGPASYPLGSTQVAYTSQDGAGNQASCTTSVTVQDTAAPSLACPAPLVAECDRPGGAYVVPAAATASDACTAVAVTGPSPAIRPLGTTVVGYSAADTSGNTASCSAEIRVVDTTPPQVAVTQPEPLLETHRYRTISLADCAPVVEDACGGTLDPATYQAAITCVTSDEPDNVPGPADGNTVNDIVIVDSQTVRVRAERNDNLDGRVYEIHFRVRDAGGNVATGVCPVIVPVDECKKPEPGEPPPVCTAGDSGNATQVCAPAAGPSVPRTRVRL